MGIVGTAFDYDVAISFAGEDVYKRQVPLQADAALLNRNTPDTVDPLILRPPVKAVTILLPDVTVRT